jgi:hypothetical protein
MGMFDNVVVLDETLRCPYGHPVEGFQTKSFPDPSMATYLVNGSRVYLVTGRGFGARDDAAAEHWQLEDDAAVFHRRHAVEPVAPSREVVFYTACAACPPVLVRSGRARAWGDLIEERDLWVEFRATFDEGHRSIERTSGTRDDLVAELRADGLPVMRDDAPLAIAHREIRAARVAGPRHRRR